MLGIQVGYDGSDTAGRLEADLRSLRIQAEQLRHCLNILAAL